MQDMQMTSIYSGIGLRVNYDVARRNGSETGKSGLTLYQTSSTTNTGNISGTHQALSPGYSISSSGNRSCPYYPRYRATAYPSHRITSYRMGFKVPIVSPPPDTKLNCIFPLIFE